MSLILDALKKSESRRQSLTDQQAEPNGGDADGVAAAGDSEAPAGGRLRVWLLAALVVVGGGWLGATLWLPGAGPEPSPRAADQQGASPQATPEQAAPKETAPEKVAAAPGAMTPPEREPQAPAVEAAALPSPNPVPAPQPAPAAAPEPAPDPAPTPPEPKIEPRIEPQAQPKTEPTPEPKPEPAEQAPAVEAAVPPPAAEPPPEAMPEAPAPVKAAPVKTAGGRLASAQPRRKPGAPGPVPVAGADPGPYLERGRAFEQEGLYERAIEEYTQAIVLDPDAAEPYFGRGWAHEGKGAHGPAIRNFSAAIARNPDFAEAYFGRGWAYEQRGEVIRAIGEYSEAVRLRPGFTDARFSRGVLRFTLGRLDAAAEDFAAVHRSADPGLRDYALMWRYVSEVRNGRDGTAAIGAFASTASRDTWPGVILALFAGNAGPADVFAHVRHPDPKVERERECIAYFFLAQRLLVDGDRAGAADYLRKTLATGVTYYRQYAAARSELERLGPSN